MATTKEKNSIDEVKRAGSSPAKQTRLNVNINSQTAAALAAYADENDVSITEAVRRLVGVGHLIAEAQAQDKQVLLRQGDETERVIFTF